MSVTPPLLPALLDVLDRADDGQATLKVRLLQAAQALETSHDPVVIEAAVNAHLATVPKLTRAQAAEARQAQLKRLANVLHHEPSA